MQFPDLIWLVCFSNNFCPLLQPHSVQQWSCCLQLKNLIVLQCRISSFKHSKVALASVTAHFFNENCYQRELFPTSCCLESGPLRFLALYALLASLLSVCTHGYISDFNGTVHKKCISFNSRKATQISVFFINFCPNNVQHSDYY